MERRKEELVGKSEEKGNCNRKNIKRCRDCQSEGEK